MKSRFICTVSSLNLWEDHHRLILSLRPAMGIRRAGYQTAQSAGKSRERAAGTSGPSRRQPRVNDDAWPGAKLLAGSPPQPAFSLSLSLSSSVLVFFFTRIRFSLLHSIALRCHFLKLLSFPRNMALRQLARVLRRVISFNFY